MLGCTRPDGLAVVRLALLAVPAVAGPALTVLAEAALGDAVLAPAGAAMARNESVATAATAATDSLAGKSRTLLEAR